MLRFAICCIVTLAILSTSAYAATYTVRPDGSGDYPTIQAAIDAVFDEDIIELTDGTFTGDGNRDLDFYGKAIEIRSQSGEAAQCIIDCEESGRAFYFHDNEDSTSVVRGITVTNGVANGSYPLNCGAGILCHGCPGPSVVACVFRENHALNQSSNAPEGGGAYCYGSSPILRDCTFDSNSARAGGGVSCKNSGAQITDCTFVNNESISGGGAIYTWHASPTIRGATLCGNSSSESQYGGGFCLGEASEVSILNTIIASSPSGAAVYVSPATPVPTMSCCDLFGNAGGDWTDDIAHLDGVDGNISEDPLFCDASENDFHLQLESPCAPFSPPNDECDLIGAWPIGCAESTYTVHPDGSGDFPTIQAAIDASADGDVIELTHGTFVGAGNRNLDLLGKAITIRKRPGNIQPAVIDCQYEGRGVWLHSGEDSLTVLQDITIMNGFLIADGYGAGIFCDGASPSIVGCTLRDHVVNLHGAGMYCTNGSSPHLEQCTFADNATFAKGGGFACAGSSSPRFSKCVFTGNSADINGGGIRCAEYSVCVLDSCEFAGNTAGDAGGAIHFRGGSQFTITASVFIDNTADQYGGAIWCDVDTHLNLFDSTFEGNNAAIRGGAMHCDLSSQVLVEDCAFSGNSASEQGGAIKCKNQSGPILTRCTFEDNFVTSEHGGALSCGYGSSPAITECNFEGNSATTDGGAVSCYSSSGPLCLSCQFTNNSAGGDGGAVKVTADGQARFEHCTFNGNTAEDRGGALFGYSTTTELLSCTLYGNGAVGGGGLFCDSQSATLDNCILAFGTGGGAIGHVGSGTPDLSCCDIYGNEGGDWEGWIAFLLGIGGNATVDPWLCNPEQGNFFLHEDSPCAPFTPPNESCDLIGAWPVGCAPMNIQGEHNTTPAKAIELSISPNPLVNGTQIRLASNHGLTERCELTICDVAGRRVWQCNPRLSSGTAQTIAWDGADNVGNTVASGIYFVRLRVGDAVRSRTCLVAR